MADYSYLSNEYPQYVSKEQFCKIAHIAKRTALYYLDNNFIPCKKSKKKTRKYRIRIRDIIFFMEDRDVTPEKYYLPNHYNNPRIKKHIKQKNRICREDYKKRSRLKPYDEEEYYIKYLTEQFRYYPDMMKGKEIRQVTGYPIKVILTWCRDEKVKSVVDRGVHYFQKQSVIDFLDKTEKQNAR